MANQEITDNSKTISTTDDAAKSFIIASLSGSVTRGFDVESIYVEEKEDGNYHWRIFEFLKCINCPPNKSNPNYFWNDRLDSKTGKKLLATKESFLVYGH